MFGAYVQLTRQHYPCALYYTHFNDMRWRHDDDGVHFLYDMYYVSYKVITHFARIVIGEKNIL